jgi:hypothetical protein
MIRRAGLTVTVLLVVLLVVSTSAYRYAYGSWWQTPERIPYCGRSYVVGATGLTIADVRSRERRTALPGDRAYPLLSVGSVPPVVGGEVLAAVTPEAHRRKLGVPCAMGLYLETGRDRYTAYSITGGP